MLSIRLKPTGKKKRIAYRVVVMEKRSKMDGRATDDLGYYNPYMNPAVFSVDKKRMDHWVGQGAQISSGVKKLIDSFAK